MMLKIKMATFCGVALFGSVLSSFGSTTNLTQFYSDDFEGYATNTVLNKDVNSAVSNWFCFSEDVDGVTVQDFDYYSGTRSAMMHTDSFLTNRVSSAPETNVWVTMYSRLVRYDGDAPPVVDTNSSAFFYVNNDGYFTLWDGVVTNWVVVSNTVSGASAVPVQETEWVKLDMLMDYIDRSWSFRVDDIPMKNDIGFVDPSISRINEIAMYNGSGNTFIDDVTLSYYNVSPRPDLEVSVSSVTLSAMVGDNVAGSFEVYNVNKRGLLEFTVTADAPWINITPPNSGSSTGQSREVKFNFSTAGLSPGTSNANIVVTGTNWATGQPVQASPRNVRAVFEIYTGPKLAVSSTALAATVPQGYDADTLSFDVWNAESGILDYSITDSVPWMVVSPASGSSSGDRERASVLFSTANLDPGVYNGVVGVSGFDRQSGVDVTDSPQQVEVTLTVEPRAVLECSESELSSVIIQGDDASAQSFTVQNGSVTPKGALKYSISESIPWLNLSPTGGTLTVESDAITVTYDTSLLTPGQYTGVIKVEAIDVLTDDMAVNSPWEVAVLLSVRPTPAGDFDGSGKAALAVYHQASGLWYIRSVEGEIIAWAVEFGGPGYAPVAGEYTGDGRMDLGVYHPETGMWFVRSLDSSYVEFVVNCGGAGFSPVYGDFDGDGRRDFAVYHEASGNWYALSSSSGSVIMWAEMFGGPGFMPVPADYDGDGKTDLGAYQPSTGKWYIKKTSGPVLIWGADWGGPGHIPVVGDYTGNGVADIAVYHEPTGNWYIRTMQGSLVAWGLQWGGSGFSPVIGDYNGDMKDDMAVYNRVSGKWYIYSASGSIIGWDMTWGGPGFNPAGIR